MFITFIAEMKTANRAVQRGVTKVLGYIATTEFPQGTRKAVECLMGVTRRVVRLLSPLFFPHTPKLIFSSLESKVHTVWRRDAIPMIHLPAS